MVDKQCTYCGTFIPSWATVCRGCGAQKKARYDSSTLGKLKGYLGAVVAGFFFGGLLGLFTYAIVGWVAGIIISVACVMLVNKFGARIEYWER